MRLLGETRWMKYFGALTLAHLAAAAPTAAFDCSPDPNPGENDPPVAIFDLPRSGEVGDPIEADGNKSCDAEGDIVRYTWDFGDGTRPSTPSSRPSSTAAPRPAPSGSG